MDNETMYESVTDNAATFTATMFYRDLSHMETDVLEHDGSVVLLSQAKMQGKHDIWRAMYEANTNKESMILIVTPNMPAARGTILTIEDEMERTPFPENVWGVKRTTDYEIEFENGSRIKTVHMQGQMGADRLRGYHPDLLVVHDWKEEGVEISDEVKENVLAPMAVGESDIWINARDVQDDALFDIAYDKGAYIKRMER